MAKRPRTSGSTTPDLQPAVAAPEVEAEATGMVALGWSMQTAAIGAAGFS